MCGIVGFIGDCAIKNVISGLKLLEYRGYDSAGVAFMEDNRKPYIVKSEGRVAALEAKINGKNNNSGTAIAHTRWATHGKPSEVNAHPHVSGNIALVHNGIIENYLELKEWLKNFGARIIVSETDTEAIAHLIDVSVGDCLFDKARRAIERLEGSYALAIISDDDPDTIIVTRKKSPLVVGVFEEGAVVASDINVILPHTNRVFVLDDNEIAIVKKNYVSIHNEAGVEVKKDPLEIPWSIAEISKGNFDTFMDKEIHEQPIAIYDTIIKNDWYAITEEIGSLFSDGFMSNVILTACGTSLHACMVGSMIIESNSRVRSYTKLASEMEASSTILNSKDLVIALSQSGETADTLQAIRYAKRKGATVLSVVNTIGSSIERESDFTIHMAAGPEISVASTKAFVAQLSVLIMLSMAITSVYWGKFHMDKIFKDAQEKVYKCADQIKDIFRQEDKIKDIAKLISSKNSILYLGRGLNVPVALEGALKLKEISYIHAEGFAAGEMKHGPIALIGEGTPVVAIITNDKTYKRMLSNIEEAKARGAMIIAVATYSNSEIENIADHVIYIPGAEEIFIPLLATIPLQLLAMYTAEHVGADIDKPKNLAKSVTVE
jgi:glucosamine--fructose-6-phosphate aminotransferase (isomerizing)